MILTRTPHRLSLCGGGTDIPPLCHELGGMVVGGAITQYAHVVAKRLPPFHGYKSRITYNKIESVSDHSEIEHRAVRACLDFLRIDYGVEILYQADIPARSGTGSSSTALVGLLNALAGLEGKFFTPERLAREAILIERDVLQENVGYQDQIWAASHTGGPATIRFLQDGTYVVSPLGLTADAARDLEEHLFLFFTNMPRNSTEVAATYYDRLKDMRQYHYSLLELTERAVTAIRRSDHEGLGKLLDLSWRAKSMLSPAVNPPRVSELYMRARLAGAWGGKLMGAGGGGTLVVAAPKEKSVELIAEMVGQGCVHIPFRFAPVGSYVAMADSQ